MSLHPNSLDYLPTRHKMLASPHDLPSGAGNALLDPTPLGYSANFFSAHSQVSALVLMQMQRSHACVFSHVARPVVHHRPDCVSTSALTQNP